MLLVRSAVVLLLLATCLATPGRRRRIKDPGLEGSDAINTQVEDASEADGATQEEIGVSEHRIKRKRRPRRKEVDSRSDWNQEAASGPNYRKPDPEDDLGKKQAKMASRTSWINGGHPVPPDYEDYHDNHDEAPLLHDDEEDFTSRSGIKANPKCAMEVKLAVLEERLRLKKKAQREDQRRREQMLGQMYGPQYPPQPAMPPMDYMMAPPSYESDPYMSGMGFRMGEEKSKTYGPEPIEPEQMASRSHRPFSSWA